MIFFGENSSGIFRLPSAAKIEIDSEVGVAADSLCVVFVSAELPQLWRIYGCSDDCLNVGQIFTKGKMVFLGIVDEQRVVQTGSGVSVTITARSPAAAALDCECESGQYTDASAEVMFSQHLERFGIKNGSGDKSGTGVLNIPKGVSHYEAVGRFCRQILNTEPRINSVGVFYWNAFQDSEEIVFDNDAGVGFWCAEYIEKRCERISGVIVNTDGGVCVCEDEEAARNGVVRERRLDLRSSATGTLSDADRLIDRGRRKSEQLRLWCSGYTGDIVGMKAKVEGTPMNTDDGDVYVTAVKYISDQNGERTRVTLGRS